MSPKRRYPPRPLLGVSAIIPHQRRVLLVQRGRAPLKGLWSFPGGLVKTGESLEAAVRRELAEETGTQARFTAPPEPREIIVRDANGQVEHHYVLMVFAGDYEGGEARPGGDAAAVKWAGRSQAARLPLTDGALELIDRFLDG